MSAAKEGSNKEEAKHVPIELVEKGENWLDEVKFDGTTVTYEGLQSMQLDDRQFQVYLKTNPDYAVAYDAYRNNDFGDNNYRLKDNINARKFGRLY